MLRLRNHLLPLLRASFHASTFSSPLQLRRLLPSTAAASPSVHLSRLNSAAARSATATPFSVEEYLVGTCGLTGAQALEASKKVSSLKSPSKPDAVVAILSGLGLSRADLAVVIAAEPRILRIRPHNIGLRITALRDRVGLSDPQIVRILLSGGARGLQRGDMSPRLEFWIPFVGSFDTLLKILKRNNAIVFSNIEKVIKPNIALLRECGLRDCEIVQLSKTAARILTYNPERVKAVVQRAEKLRMLDYSWPWAFKHIVVTAARCNEGIVAARMEFLTGALGCSVDKLRSAVCKCPRILELSESKLLSKIEFLVTKVRVEPDYILHRPVLLTYSLEKRLVPRHYVVEVLLVKGLIKGGVDFYGCVCLSDKDFVARYIEYHENDVPGLADAYTAVCSGKSPPLI
ncbi:uncharacterized protein LOC102707893 [Oryza brachyantha]|uniref:Uncharacterized protein n=1 Tax=Oryza brachyantha TaxID=4533 RepID=J3MUM7_ORYBR|nr:uncharacterized protein LOC102707893 [Oryza brachyantha]